MRAKPAIPAEAKSAMADGWIGVVRAALPGQTGATGRRSDLTMARVVDRCTNWYDSQGPAHSRRWCVAGTFM
jgi:hypothetical protein